MDRTLPPVYFYIPKDELHQHLPDCAADYWQWRIDMSNQERFLGKFDWTLQTYLHLKDTGFPCKLVTTPPANGIVLAHKDFLEDIPRPNPSTLLICLKSDRFPHTFAQVHIVQNPEDRVEKNQKQLIKSFFIPHWVQPLLIPRSKERGEVFENIAYLGCEIELAAEFKERSWQDLLKRSGFNWIMATTADKWVDYSDLDALVAVRKCKSRSKEFNPKPATKLYNAWHAGIPAILGVESAYIGERKSEVDYIEVNSPAEVIRALERLRDDRNLRDKMLTNGKIRAEETKSNTLVKIWQDFLITVAAPAYHKWCSSEWTRKKYFLMCPVRQVSSRMKRGVSKIARGLTRSVKKS